MGSDYESLEYWRRFFRTAPAVADIFEVVERAIAVAAADNSDELRRRRDRIAELLFTATFRFPASSADEPTPNPRSEVDEEEVGEEVDEEGDGSVRKNEVEIDDNRIVSNYSFDEAAALTEETEERSQYVGEVFRIKDIILNKDNESDSVLFDCLRRLQLMTLSYDTLSATAIGKAVNGLRKHSSKQIRNLVRTLIDGWKVTVDEWVKNTSVIAEKSPDSVNPSSTLDEEEGLPSPPLDEGAFLATHANIQLSGFFEGMDDDGNPRTSMESDHHLRNARGRKDNKSAVDKKQHVDQQIQVNLKMRNQGQVDRQATELEVMRGEVKHQNVSKPNKPTSMGPSRPPRPASEQKASNPMTFNQREEVPASQRKPLTAQTNKIKHIGNDFEEDLQARLEVAKRKLHVGYQVADNAKKQRTIQVVEPHDLPKQPNHHRLPSNMKPKNNNLRNRLFGRR